jgi:hypothetical protein
VTVAQPQALVPTVGVPVQQAAVLTTAAPQAAPAAGLATTTQTVRPARTRFALAPTRVPISFSLPWFRLVPYTVPGEVTTTTEFETAPQTAAVPTTVMALAPQPQIATTAFVQPTTMAVQPTTMAVQPAVAVQSAPVAVSAVAPQQQVTTAALVQPTTMAAQPTTVAIQPSAVLQTAPSVVAQPQAAPAGTVLGLVTVPQTTAAQVSTCPPVSQDTLQRLSQELEQTKALLSSMGAASTSQAQSGKK